ncbi:MAG: tripartite tricarboxylate transporter TctB family protein [Rhodospirillaceae bacterium]|nr:tripartite tricarboxylate transporter TctB family protein [Rhodospirillaceae bacterium]MCA8934206.1 tripartite tricarboxylate transporter TctB family protein [Rhodospirillaceae bacterium]
MSLVSLRLVVATILAAIGAAAFVIGLDYDFGSATRMGPGYFPLVLSGLLTVLALAEAVSAVLKPDPDDSPTLDWRPLVAILGAVGGFAVAISLFGLVPAFFVVILFSTLSERGYGWLPATVLSLVTCFAAWLLFSRLLGITLPLFRWGL